MGARARNGCSGHAQRRGSQRGISEADIEMVLGYGRCVYTRRAWIHVVGRAEVCAAQKEGVDLRPVEGIHVVLDPRGPVRTVYRNQHLNLRPLRRRRPRR
jgi:hypothetical protein